MLLTSQWINSDLFIQNENEFWFINFSYAIVLCDVCCVLCHRNSSTTVSIWKLSTVETKTRKHKIIKNYEELKSNEIDNEMSKSLV